MRALYPILGLVLVVGGLAGIKFKQISSMIGFAKAAQKAGPPPESVGTATATETEWAGQLEAVGSVAPARGVTISNEVAGLVTAIHFDSGAQARAGQTLIELDSSVERAQLASAKARRDVMQQNVGRSEKLASSAAISAQQLDTDLANAKASTADAEALEAQIARKTVRAPFAGRLGIRAVNLGQYLNPGTPITTLESLGAIFVDFALPQQRLEQLRLGAPVRISIEGSPQPPMDGVVAAIEPGIDTATRSIKLRASVPNPKDVLRPGMFVKVSIGTGDKSAVVIAPTTALVHAAYGDSVFVVENAKDGNGKIVRQQFVRTGPSRGDFTLIEDGVKAGQELVTSGAFKLRNGARIVVQNETPAKPMLTPAVENR
jgi:membrane fusion protein (multidrug efflux system)